MVLTSTSPLQQLFLAIVARDAARVSRLLAEAPLLAKQPLALGATRENPSQFYFESITHYAYAGDTALHVAAAAYAVVIANSLLAQGAHVSARNRRGAEPLHYACDGVPGSPAWDPGAQYAVVKLLLEAGANPNAEDKSGVCPLHRAVRTRSTGAVRALLEHGAQASRANKSGSTPLSLALHDTGRGGSGSAEAREQQAQIVALLRSHGAK